MMSPDFDDHGPRQGAPTNRLPLKKSQTIKLLVLIQILFLVFIETPFAGTMTDKPVIQPATSIMKQKGLLLFFLNSQGRPCQMQLAILEENRPAIEKYYLIKMIDIKDTANRRLFYQFGVRNMPLIILLNPNGTVHRRLPPGILPAELILNAIKSEN